MNRTVKIISIIVIVVIGLLVTSVACLRTWRKPVDEHMAFKIKLSNPMISPKAKQANSCVLIFNIYTTESTNGSLVFNLSQTEHSSRETSHVAPAAPLKEGSYPISIIDLNKCLSRGGCLNQWEVAVDAPGPLRLKIWRKTGNEWEMIAESQVENAKTGLNIFNLNPPLNVQQGDYAGFYMAWNPGPFPVKVIKTSAPSSKVYVRGDFHGKVPESAMFRDKEGNYDFKIFYSLFDTTNQVSVSVVARPGKASYVLELPPDVDLNGIELSIKASKGVSAFICPNLKNIMTGIGLYAGIQHASSASKSQVRAMVIDQRIQRRAGRLMHNAISDWNIQKVREILDAYPICLINMEEKSPLAYACEEGSPEIVELLLKKNACVNERDASDNTPLHFAAGKGYDDIIKLLISQKAEVNAANCHGDTPLFWAVNTNHIESAKLLIENGAYVNQKNEYEWTPLHLAADKGHRKIADILIDNGAEVNARDSQGVTPVFWAINASWSEVVELLLKNGATVNLPDNQGWTPLHWAVNHGDKEIIQLLINGGADVHAKDKLGHTPLFWVRNESGDDIVELLVSKGADVNATNKWGYSVLDWTMENGDGELVEALLARGANVSKLDPSGGVLLFSAIENGWLNVVSFLVSHGVNIRVQNKTGQTPLHLASSRSLAVLLIQHGADVNARDLQGRTPLHDAAMHGRRETAVLLINKGADINARDQDGHTPLWWAQRERQKPIVKLLRDFCAEQ